MAQPPKPPRIFLDASIIFAAAASQTGASRAVVLLMEIGLIRGVVSPQVDEEVVRNLSQKAPVALPFYQRLRAVLEWEVTPDPDPAQVSECARVIAYKDAPILAAAMSARVSRFLTLDTQHFTPKVIAFSKLHIQSPAEFINEIRELLSTGLAADEEPKQE